jgi:HD-GYP domain-containing protein (c-di-GMP phosphodiesterase class II)
VDEALQALAREGRRYDEEYTIFRASDSEERYVHSKADLIRDSAGAALKVIGVVQDVTEARQAEAALRASHATNEVRLRRLVALREIRVAITSARELRTTADQILDHLIASLEVDAADILLFRSADTPLEPVGARGISSQALAAHAISADDPYLSWVLEARQPLFVTDVAEASGGMAPAERFPDQLVSYAAVPLVAGDQLKGVLEVFNRRLTPFDDESRNYLQTLALDTAIAIDNTELFSRLEQANQELSAAYDATIEGWSRALELRDKETQGHSERVTSLTLAFAAALGLPREERTHIRRGVLLHDIGKMGIPDSILLKPAALTPEEFAIMRQHTVYAFQLLSPIPYLRPALDVPYGHHEKWDGSGYPYGLKGDDIPLSARVVALADVYDALVSARVYKQPLTHEDAVAYIVAGAGTHFDPQVVAAFAATADRFRTVGEENP